jgi:hypothetical protein
MQSFCDNKTRRASRRGKWALHDKVHVQLLRAVRKELTTVTDGGHGAIEIPVYTAWQPPRARPATPSRVASNCERHSMAGALSQMNRTPPPQSTLLTHRNWEVKSKIPSSDKDAEADGGCTWRLICMGRLAYLRRLPPANFRRERRTGPLAIPMHVCLPLLRHGKASESVGPYA